MAELEKPMSPADYRTASYAAAIARHLAANDVDAANVVLVQVHQEGLNGGLLRAFSALVGNYGERLLGSWEAVREDLTDISIKMALAAERAAGAAEPPDQQET